MKRKIAFGVLALAFLVAQTQAQDKNKPRPMMDTTATKNKMMEPAMMDDNKMKSWRKSACRQQRDATSISRARRTALGCSKNGDGKTIGD